MFQEIAQKLKDCWGVPRILSRQLRALQAPLMEAAKCAARPGGGRVGPSEWAKIRIGLGVNRHIWWMYMLNMAGNSHDS